MRIPMLATSVLVLAMSGCNSAPAADVRPALTKADAQSVFDKTEKTLATMNADKFDDLYADDVTAFDVDVPGRLDGSVMMHPSNLAFANMKFDNAQFPDNKIQILGPDAFIASGTAHFTSSTGAVKEADVRYSEVYKRQSDGSWKIVHEHVDFPPKPAAT